MRREPSSIPCPWDESHAYYQTSLREEEALCHTRSLPPKSGVKWAFDSQARLLHDMRVNLSRAHILMAEQLLHGANVITGFQQVRRKTMAQRVATGRLGNSRG